MLEQRVQQIGEQRHRQQPAHRVDDVHALLARRAKAPTSAWLTPYRTSTARMNIRRMLGSRRSRRGERESYRPRCEYCVRNRAVANCDGCTVARWRRCARLAPDEPQRARTDHTASPAGGALRPYLPAV